MKNLAISLLAVMLVACGGGGSSSPTPPPPPPPPAEGTLLSSECREYTLVERFADGQGGSTEQVTTRSPDCGWNPTPYGELSETFCEDPYTLVSVYHDGEYGFYEEREEDVEECGYIPPSLEVTIDNTYGDRFRPVVVTVDYKVQGEPAEWTFEIEMGRAVRVDDNTLHIYGDGTGNSVDFILYINDETFLYQLREEPRCGLTILNPVEQTLTDCEGYRQVNTFLDETGLIYYGEGDQEVVQVELAVTRYFPDFDEPTQTSTPEAIEYVQGRVDKYNELMARFGIYIEFVLVGVWNWDNIDLRAGERFIRTLPADIGLGLGTTYPNTCGVAYANIIYNKAGFGFSNCDEKVDLHELGHVVGLAHGPNNSAYPSKGYLFPDFGHGDYDQCGSRTDDIMSYGTKDHFFNSTQTCDEVFPSTNPYVGPAGDRNRADSAYHWNRVRYDLSLIHDEHAKKSPADARQVVVPLDDDRPLIID